MFEEKRFSTSIQVANFCYLNDVLFEATRANGERIEGRRFRAYRLEFSLTSPSL
ncbi:MAG: hypothetical protein QW290_08435 [Sulfolobales archaeon]